MDKKLEEEVGLLAMAIKNSVQPEQTRRLLQNDYNMRCMAAREKGEPDPERPIGLTAKSPEQLARVIIEHGPGFIIADQRVVTLRAAKARLDAIEKEKANLQKALSEIEDKK